MIDQLIDEALHWRAVVAALQADRDRMERQRDQALAAVALLRCGMKSEEAEVFMPCEPQTFKGVTRSAFIALCARVQQQLGIAISTDQGSASQSGFTVAWDYEADAQVLTLQVREKPFFLPSAVVNDQVRKLVSG